MMHHFLNLNYHGKSLHVHKCSVTELSKRSSFSIYSFMFQPLKDDL